MSEKVREGSASAILLQVQERARHPKTVAAAERLREACDYLSAHKIRISIREVAQLCSDKGPRIQSIHNNKMFKAYILARAAEQKLPLAPRLQSQPFDISDPELRAYVYALKVDARREQQRRENLTNALSNGGQWDLEQTIESGKLVPRKGQSSPVPANLSASLRRLLDPDHLRRFDLHFVRDRIVAVNRNNRIFLEKSDLDVIAEAAGIKADQK